MKCNSLRSTRMTTNSEKIGILTYHNTTNYGATLQAYALQTRLGELGVKSEIIDYRPIKATRMYRRALIPSRFWVYNVLKILAFAYFRKQHLTLSPQTVQDLEKLPNLVSKYSRVICGSDEIWNVESFRGFDPGFYLPFKETKNVLKFSYAASAGATKSFGEYKAQIANALRSFQNISVRDEFTKSLLESECELNVEQVVDPTLLVDFQEFLQEPAIKKKPYVLIYGTLSADEEVSAVNIASELKCEIISVGEFNRCANKNLLGASVKQWLNLINNADYVLTSFYHGAIFSWKFDKPFIFLRRASKTTKFDGFVKDLALSDAPYLSAVKGEHQSSLREYSSSSDTIARLELAKTKADDFLLKCCA